MFFIRLKLPHIRLMLRIPDPPNLPAITFNHPKIPLQLDHLRRRPDNFLRRIEQKMEPEPIKNLEIKAHCSRVQERPLYDFGAGLASVGLHLPVIERLGPVDEEQAA